MSEQAREVSKKLMEAAKKFDTRLREIGVQARVSTMEIGYIGRQMKDQNLFSILGYEAENDYRMTLQIGRSTWFRYIRIAEGFKKLTKRDFLKLQAEKAELAVQRLSEEERYKPEWLELMAANGITEEEFEKKLVKHEAVEQGVEEQDVRVTLKLRMYESQRTAILATMDKFAKAHGLKSDDHGAIVEYICAEASNGNNVLAAIQQSLPELRMMLELIKDSSLSADEILEKLKGACEKHILALAKAAGVQVKQFDPKTVGNKPQLVSGAAAGKIN